MPVLDWSSIHQIFPTLPLGAALFDRLRRVGVRVVLVTGCQRSGTTWLTRLLAGSLDRAMAPKELEACNFLVYRNDIPLDKASALVLQTTFANVEIESYARLQDEVCVILLARNPFSVCWSMVYHWQNLTLEYDFRKRTIREEDCVQVEPEPWRMALELYRHSMRSGLKILSDRPRRTRLLVYDELVHNVPACVRALEMFLDIPLTLSAQNVTADLVPSQKHQSLPVPFRNLIEQHCEPSFIRLQEAASGLGSRITL